MKNIVMIAAVVGLMACNSVETPEVAVNASKTESLSDTVLIEIQVENAHHVVTEVVADAIQVDTITTAAGVLEALSQH